MKPDASAFTRNPRVLAHTCLMAAGLSLDEADHTLRVIEIGKIASLLEPMYFRRMIFLSLGSKRGKSSNYLGSNYLGYEYFDVNTDSFANEVAKLVGSDFKPAVARISEITNEDRGVLLMAGIVESADPNSSGEDYIGIREVIQHYGWKRYAELKDDHVTLDVMVRSIREGIDPDLLDSVLKG